MARLLQSPISLLVYATLFSCLLQSSNCLSPKLFNFSMAETDDSTGWSIAAATWYGSPVGAGSDGGACGYGDTVEGFPLNKMVSAGGPSLFKQGKGCGACYQVKCTSNVACSGRPVTATITDECPGCTDQAFHFDLSGAAFGAMAKPGLADQLRNVGLLQIMHTRVQCSYPGVPIKFHVDSGSNPYYFATAIEYEGGDGDLRAVELKQSGDGSWVAMQQLWGAVWKLNWGSRLQPPMSIRVTTLKSGYTLVAKDVIPNGWQPGQTYQSHVNFGIP